MNKKGKILAGLLSGVCLLGGGFAVGYVVNDSINPRTETETPADPTEAGDGKIVAGEYYCAYVEDVVSYQAIMLNDEDDKVYLYICPASESVNTLDKFMMGVKGGFVAPTLVTDEYEAKDVDGRDVVELQIQTQYGTMIYTAIASQDSKTIFLNEKQIYSGSSTWSYDHVFTLYE